MGTNKEKTPSAAMKKLLLQSASKKEQEIQQIGSTGSTAGTDGNRISRTGKQKNGRRQREWEKILGISGRA